MNLGNAGDPAAVHAEPTSPPWGRPPHPTIGWFSRPQQLKFVKSLGTRMVSATTRGQWAARTGVRTPTPVTALRQAQGRPRDGQWPCGATAGVPGAGPEAGAGAGAGAGTVGGTGAVSGAGAGAAARRSASALSPVVG